MEKHFTVTFVFCLHQGKQDKTSINARKCFKRNTPQKGKSPETPVHAKVLTSTTKEKPPDMPKRHQGCHLSIEDLSDDSPFLDLQY